MRKFETTVQELKSSVLEEVAVLAWEDRLTTGILDIPEKIIPGPEARMRCCIYKERAVISSRVKPGLHRHPLCSQLSQGGHFHRQPPGHHRPLQVYPLRQVYLCVPLWGH